MPEVRITIGGAEYPLRFDWARLDQIETEKIDLADLANRRTLARVLSIATGGAISPEEVYAASPPIGPTGEALGRALGLAWRGTEEAPAAPPAGPPVPPPPPGGSGTTSTSEPPAGQG